MGIALIAPRICVTGIGSLMKEISQVLLFDSDRRLLVYLRDDNPAIPFPNHWDFFGGHLEEGETAEQALVREVKEELGVELKRWKFFRLYHCTRGDAYPNLKYIYWAEIDQSATQLTLNEGQRLMSITPNQGDRLKFANILAQILEDFIESGFWPEGGRNS